MKEYLSPKNTWEGDFQVCFRTLVLLAWVWISALIRAEVTIKFRQCSGCFIGCVDVLGAQGAIGWSWNMKPSLNNFAWHQKSPTHSTSDFFHIKIKSTHVESNPANMILILEPQSTRPHSYMIATSVFKGQF